MQLLDLTSGPLLEYREGWALQRRIHAEVVAGTREDTLILCEHEPVFTAGTRTSDDERPTDGTPVVDVDRGGKLTWHGPGQLTGYPIMHVPMRATEPRPDSVGFVRRIETMLVDLVAAFGVHGERVEGRSGVWVDEGPSMAKVAAIGMRIDHDVAMHGFAINCGNDLSPFGRIVPCGIRDAGVTTLTRASGRPVTPQDVAPLVLPALLAVLTPAVAA